MKLIKLKNINYLIFFFTEDNGMSIMCTDGEKYLYNSYFFQSYFLEIKEKIKFKGDSY